jgi:hypothetical protein
MSELKRRLRDEVLWESDSPPDGVETLTLKEILRDIPQKDWDKVKFYWCQWNDYYEGWGPASCRFFIERDETDAEYKKRLALLREEDKA